jgi:hypothetical protein
MLLVVLLSLQGCVTGAALDTERQRGDEADKALQDKNWPQAQIAFKAYIGGAGFGRLAANVQYQALRSAAFVGLYHGDKEAGYRYFVRAVAMPQADAQAWSEFLKVAVLLKHNADAARALVVIQQRYPESLSMMDDSVLGGAVQALETLPPTLQFSSLLALYDAHFTYKWGQEANGTWRSLTLRLLEHNRPNEAIEVASHINDAVVLMTMRVDRRFDTVTTATPAHFDIDAAAREQLRIVQDLSDQYPEILELKLEVVSALRHLRRYGAMLAATDELMSEIEATNYPQRLFKDTRYVDWYRWLLNFRSVALERLGRSDEAVAQLQAASRLTERGAKNVTQVLNLGELYCRLNRPKDALAAIAEVGSMTPHGRMQLESVRFEAAVQLNDAAQIEQSLGFMNSHVADGPEFLLSSWLITGDFDLAAKSFIVRLFDPEQRYGALRSVQDYSPIPESDWEKRFDAQWRVFMARPDVQAAINKVGRAESFRLELFD